MNHSSRKSFVWQHFKKSEIPSHARCDHCKRLCKTTNGNTSGLMFHLLRHHNKSYINSEPHRKWKFIPYGMQPSKYWGSVWKYYTQNSARQTAECKKCHKEFRAFRNIATLKRHYLSCYNALELDSKKKSNCFVGHEYSNQEDIQGDQTSEDPLKPDETLCSNTREEKNDDDECDKLDINNSVLIEGSSRESNKVIHSEQEAIPNTQTARSNRSFVWNYFERLENRKGAVCTFCREEYKTSGNTTNLLQHLVRRHGTLLSSDVDGKYSIYKKNPAKKDISEYEQLTPVESKGPHKSFVWLHFQKTNMQHVALCNYCSKPIRTSGSTSGLRYHLMKHHRDRITKSGDRVDSEDPDEILDVDYLLKGVTYDGNSIEVDLDYDEQTEETVVGGDESSDDIFKKKPNGRCKSFVWKHFKKTDLLDKAICNYCSKYCNTTSGNTTGLKFHLLKYHRSQIKNEKPSFVTKNTISGKRSRSFVWDHFEKTQQHNQVVCVHCSRQFNSSGNTSNLRDHLLRKHTEEFGEMANKELEQLIRCEVVPSTENPQNDDLIEAEEAVLKKQPKCTRSFVWDHFEKSDNGQKAMCKYCKRHISTCGNTTNLRSHFSTCQKRKQSQRKGEVMKTFFNEFSKYISDQDENSERIEPESEENDKQDVADESHQLLPNQSKSLIWNHFVKNENQFKATCVYCNKEFGRTTSNLWRHFMRFHKDVANDDVLDKIGSKNRCKSLVWNHFEKDKDSTKSICKYCGQLCSSFGNTSNLWKHLTKKHSELIHENIENDDTDMENTEIDCDESTNLDEIFQLLNQADVGYKRTRSAIWNHFIHAKDIRKATCIHCRKTYTTFGNTSNLWAHMLRNHKKILESVKKAVDEVDEIPSKEHDEEEDPTEREVEDETINHSELVESIYESNDDNPDNEASEKSDECIISDHYLQCEIKGTEKSICTYCKAEFDSNSFTDLWNHLVENHNEHISLASKDDQETPPDNETIFLVEEHLEEDGNPKKRGRSQVWEHFDKGSVRQTAVCVYCKEQCKTHGNTTSLWNHLIKQHSGLFGISQGEEDVAEEEEEGQDEEEEVDQSEVTKEENSGSKHRRSTVWNHFKRDEALQIATCVHCDKNFMAHSTTSNLWRHLHTSHGGKLSKEDVTLSKEEDATLSKKESVPKKEDHIYCGKLGKAFQYNDLRTHLMKHHKETTTPEETSVNPDDVFQVYVSDGGIEAKDTCKRSVWTYFEKIVTPQFAICRYCDMWCEVSTNSSSLKDHLMKCHEDDIRAEEQKKVAEKRAQEISRRKEKEHESTATEDSPKVRNDVDDEDTDPLRKNFKKSLVSRFANCLQCGRLCRNTRSNLEAHLETYHKKETEEEPNVSQNDIEIQTNADDSQEMTPTKRQRVKSLVWVHFVRLGGQQAACHHCDKILKTHGNTTSLWNHLIRFHKDVMNKETSGILEMLTPTKPPEGKAFVSDFLESDRLANEQDNPSDDFPWQHFEKSLHSQYAICKHCQKLVKTAGNASSLRNHLMRSHVDVMNEEEGKTVEKTVVKLEQNDDYEEFTFEDNYISKEDIKKAKDSASVSGLDDYVILVVA